MATRVTLDKQGATTVVLSAKGIAIAAVFDGSSSCMASRSHTGNIDIVGDIDMLARVAVANWTSGTRQIFYSRNEPTTFSYVFSLDGTGHLELRHSVDGTVVLTDASTVATGFANSTTAFHWVRASRVSATGVTTFYTAVDSFGEPGSWTQLGATVSGTAGAIFAGTANAMVAATYPGTTERLAGVVARVITKSGVGGTVKSDFYPTNAVVLTLVQWVGASTGEIWLLNGTAVLTEIDTLYLATATCGAVGCTTVTLGLA